MRRVFIFCFSSLLLFYSSLFSQGNIVAKKVMPSVVLIVVEDSYGQMVGLGSGFFVSTNLIATNFHVIEGAAKGYVKLINSNKKINIDGVAGVDKVNDLVLLSVNTQGTPLNRSNNGNIEVGETIYAIGNPKGLEGTFSNGIVSSIRQIDNGKLIQITAPISPGSSGGPVVNQNGDVIGISVSTYKEGQNLNFAVPVVYLNNLLTQKQTIVDLKSVSAPVNTTITKKAGNKINEAIEVSNFKWKSDRDYFCTIKNLLRDDIKNLRFYVVFWDKNNNSIIHSELVFIKDIIPGGLAKTIIENVQIGVQDLNKDYKTQGKIEFRIIDFEIV